MSLENNQMNRIKTLDSFRVIAILSVILYHYFTRWTPPENSINLYPYGDSLNFFKYGYLGVQLFFVISGFVITLTLHNSKGFLDFWKKRLIRLFPAMLICSVIIFITFNLCDPNNIFPRSHEFKNLLVSLTFLNPEIFNIMFKGHNLNFSYLNGSYWSLWPEIQFYLLASLIYFFKPKNFFKQFFIVSFIIFTFDKLISYLGGLVDSNYFILNYSKVANIFNLNHFILWFLLGVLFFQVYSNKKEFWTNWAIALVSGCLLYLGKDLNVKCATLIIIGLFLLFLFRPSKLNFLNKKIISSLGAASFSLYLIHENLGVLLIHKFAGYLTIASIIFPIFLIVLLSIFSLLLYKYVEKPIEKFLKLKMQIKI